MMLPGDEKNYVIRVSFNEEATPADRKRSRDAVKMLNDVTPVYEPKGAKELFIENADSLEKCHDLMITIRDHVRGVQSVHWFPRSHLDMLRRGA